MQSTIPDTINIKSQWILQKILCSPNVTYIDFISTYIFDLDRNDILIFFAIIIFIVLAHNFSKVMTQKFLINDYLYLIDNY